MNLLLNQVSSLQYHMMSHEHITISSIITINKTRRSFHQLNCPPVSPYLMVRLAEWNHWWVWLVRVGVANLQHTCRIIWSGVSSFV